MLCRSRWNATRSVTFMTTHHSVLLSSRSFVWFVGLWSKICRKIESMILHVRDSCLRQMKRAVIVCIPLCIPWISWISGISGRNRFPCLSCSSLLDDSVSEDSNDSWLFCADTFTWYFSHQSSMYASFSLPWELDAASSFEFLLVLTSLLCLVGLFHTIGLFTDEELVETIEIKFMFFDIDFVAVLSASFSFLHPFRHHGAVLKAEILYAASISEMTDVGQMKKIVPFVTC